ncbi:MAG: nucleotidyltransferase family protein [Gemmatimonadaceae bacterium]
MRIAALVLAAGGSSRLGEPKQLLVDLNGETLVHRTVRNAIDAGASPVIVVIGAHAAQVAKSVQDFIESEHDVFTIENTAWKNGLSLSIQLGVQALKSMNGDVSGAMLLTCDMPSVSVSHLHALGTAFDLGAVRVASSYGSTRGIPAIISRAEFAELLNLSGDRGAKALLAQDSTEIVELVGGTFDLDTPADVAKWRAQQATDKQVARRD